MVIEPERRGEKIRLHNQNNNSERKMMASKVNILSLSLPSSFESSHTRRRTTTTDDDEGEEEEEEISDDEGVNLGQNGRKLYYFLHCAEFFFFLGNDEQMRETS